MKFLTGCYNELHVRALSPLVPYFNLKGQRISYYSLFWYFGVLNPSFGLKALFGDEISVGDNLEFPYHIGSSSYDLLGFWLCSHLVWRFVALKALSHWSLAF